MSYQLRGSTKMCRALNTGIVHIYLPGAGVSMCGRTVSVNTTSRELDPEYKSIHPEDVKFGDVCVGCDRTYFKVTR